MEEFSLFYMGSMLILYGVTTVHLVLVISKNTIDSASPTLTYTTESKDNVKNI